MLIKSDKDIILASTSPVRKKILEDVAIAFRTISPTCDEDVLKDEFIKNEPDFSIRNLAIFLSRQKALSISNDYLDSYIIGSDQVCEFDGQEISKSRDAKTAISQLSEFNGKTHFQNNGVVVAKGGKVVFESFSRVELKMRNLTKLEIENYVNYDESWGCAGSYKYESYGKHLFEKVDGDYYSVLGLAIQPLLNFLHKEGVISFS